MNILAIDQSYTSCGFVVLNEDEVIYAEKFTSNAENDIYSRSVEVAERARKIAKDYNVEYVAVEGLAFSKFGNATRDLAGLLFTIMYVLKFQEKYVVYIIPPNTAKKLATGKGTAKKQEMYECLPKNAMERLSSLGVRKSTGLLDLSDAYWIGRSAQQEKKKEEK